MGWNHRVIRYDITCPNEDFMAIHEVYYNKQGEPDAMTCEPVSIRSENLDGLKWTLNKMLEALEKPVLLESSFNDKDSN